jgi:hypothetical protein
VNNITLQPAGFSVYEDVDFFKGLVARCHSFYLFLYLSSRHTIFKYTTRRVPLLFELVDLSTVQVSSLKSPGQRESKQRLRLSGNGQDVAFIGNIGVSSWDTVFCTS